MKKNIIRVVVVALVIVTLQIITFLFLEVSDDELLQYSKYYFTKLQKDEKKIYVKIDQAIKAGKESAAIKVSETDGLADKISKVITAYFYDNPEYYYVSNEYFVKTRNFIIAKVSTIKFNYTMNLNSELVKSNRMLEDAINEILNDSVSEEMTIFEKQIAIHDALIERVSYYKYEDINQIPSIKHTAYGALVEKNAVCDGYSKAFKLLLERAGIESIIINGQVNSTPHAWNLVNIDGKYYHVDVTSDRLDEKERCYVGHAYFNITDDEIMKTHIISRNYIYPNCDSEDYNYYEYNNYYIDNNENLYNKLSEIVTKQQSSNILEVMVDGKYEARDIVDALYDINFNNWRISGKTSVTYTKIDNVYVFIK